MNGNGGTNSGATTLTLPISGLTCEHCVNKVTEALTKLPDVTTASVMLAPAQATVTGTAKLQDLIATVDEAGYDVPTTTETYGVTGLSCTSCVGKTQEALFSVQGVLNAGVTLPGEAVIQFVPEIATFQAMKSAVREVGYDLVPRTDKPTAPRERTGKATPLLVGLGGGGSLLALFFGALTLTNSFAHALEQFAELWYWVLLLAVGFGIQLGLYTHIRIQLRERASKGATAGVAASGGVSTVSMIACCAHIVPSVLPLLGVSAAAVFLVQYQLPFILLGVFSNLVGITVMLSIIQNHGLQPKTGPLTPLFGLNLAAVRNGTAVVAILIVAYSFVQAGLNPMPSEAAMVAQEKPVSLDLPARIDRQSMVTVEVTPVDFQINAPVTFFIAMNTHVAELDFDPTKIAVLKDDKANVYVPTSWEGSPPGSHHRSGTLSFPKLDPYARSITLTMENVAGVPKRVFEWEVR